ncbi:MAG: antitoxin [Actinobacteria bacterium]|nr:antitoxin [Actinomycetota bacterium]
MSDVLVRDIPDTALAAIDAKARRLGLSRQEFLRRRIVAAGGADARVTTEDLDRVGSVFADLADEELMNRAWR